MRYWFIYHICRSSVVWLLSMEKVFKNLIIMHWTVLWIKKNASHVSIESQTLNKNCIKLILNFKFVAIWHTFGIQDILTKLWLSCNQVSWSGKGTENMFYIPEFVSSYTVWTHVQCAPTPGSVCKPLCSGSQWLTIYWQLKNVACFVGLFLRIFFLKLPRTLPTTAMFTVLSKKSL